MPRYYYDDLLRRAELREEIRGLEFALHIYAAAAASARAAAVIATRLAVARAEKALIDQRFRELAGLPAASAPAGPAGVNHE